MRRGGVKLLVIRTRHLVGRTRERLVHASWCGDDQRAVEEADRRGAAVGLPDVGLDRVGAQVDEALGAFRASGAAAAVAALPAAAAAAATARAAPAPAAPAASSSATTAAALIKIEVRPDKVRHFQDQVFDGIHFGHHLL